MYGSKVLGLNEKDLGLLKFLPPVWPSPPPHFCVFLVRLFIPPLLMGEVLLGECSAAPAGMLCSQKWGQKRRFWLCNPKIGLCGPKIGLFGPKVGLFWPRNRVILPQNGVIWPQSGAILDPKRGYLVQNWGSFAPKLGPLPPNWVLLPPKVERGEVWGAAKHSGGKRGKGRGVWCPKSEEGPSLLGSSLMRFLINGVFVNWGFLVGLLNGVGV